jgi:hypothetical protein
MPDAGQVVPHHTANNSTAPKPAAVQMTGKLQKPAITHTTMPTTVDHMTTHCAGKRTPDVEPHTRQRCGSPTSCDDHNANNSRAPNPAAIKMTGDGPACPAPFRMARLAPAHRSAAGQHLTR